MTEEEDYKHILWGPRDKKSLKKLYPELENEPAFKGVEGQELLFAWYIGIPNSPVDHEWESLVRYRSAAYKCFKDEDKKREFGSGDFPDHVKRAIERFKRYSPEARAASNNIVQKIFHNFEKMVDVDVEKDFLVTRTVGKGEDREEVTEMDWTGRKQYVDSATKISETLPALLKQIEEGFGIKEKKSDEATGKSIDRFHRDNKSKSS